MTDLDALRRACLGAVLHAGLAPVGELFHRFVPSGVAPTRGDSSAPQADAAAPPAGITGVVLLAESHLAVHTWPELEAATLDVYVCNLGADNSVKAEALFAMLVDAFAPASCERHVLKRGTPPEAHT